MKINLAATKNVQNLSEVVRIILIGLESDPPAELHNYNVKEHSRERGTLTWFMGRKEEEHSLVVGVGSLATLNEEQVRIAAGNAGRAVAKEKLKHAMVQFNGLKEALSYGGGLSEHGIVQAWIEGWQLGTYTFDTYKSKPSPFTVEEMTLLLEPTAELEKTMQLAELRAEGGKLARDLANEPPNALRPSMLIARIEEMFENSSVEVHVFQGEELQKRKMNGLLAVGKGSIHAPAMVEMRYCTDPSLPLIALIGKGITFDTGGISLKNARDLSDMRMDMGGAAAVIGAMKTIVGSGMAANIVALTPLAENVPDGGSMLPGEVIEYANGVTVQVKNTDAEGRLVLADALIHAGKLGAQYMIDLATLTGACLSALGVRMAGVWATEGLAEPLQKLGEQNGEKVWPMPLEEEYEELLRSDYADLANITDVPYAGAITAALFLKRFVEPTISWAHLDIAGPMDTNRTAGYMTAGATGFGARLLVDYVQWQSQQNT